MQQFLMRLFIYTSLLILLTGCQPVHDRSQSVQERVMATGKIRCGYFDWEPLLKKNVNTGQFTGIAVDMMNELSQRLNIQYEWTEEVGPSTAVEAIKSKRIDMICLPVIITNSRMRVADFSAPVLFSRFSVWMRNDSSTTDTAELNQPKYKFAAIDGTAPMAMTKRIFPQANILSLTELSPTSDMFLSLTSGKADAVFSDTSNAGMFAKYNPGKIKPVLDQDTDRILPWAFMTPPNEYQFTRMIDLILQDMQLDHTIEKIVKKNEADNMYLLSASIYKNP